MPTSTVHLRRALPALLLLLAVAGCRPAGRPAGTVAEPTWQTLETGLELGRFRAARPSILGDSRIHVLRIDPTRFELRLLAASADPDGRPRSAREWCAERDVVAAINASMYQADQRTSTSLMRSVDHVNNSRVTRDRTVLVFQPLDADVPPVQLLDRDCDNLDDWSSRYGSMVQSIRMLSCQGANVWAPQERRWSTSAIGIDAHGRVLFIHVRSPYSTHELIDLITALPLDVERMMYTEGGAHAQLFVQGPERSYEYVGGFEHATTESENNTTAWPVPNVIAVARRDE